MIYLQTEFEDPTLVLLPTHKRSQTPRHESVWESGGIAPPFSNSALHEGEGSPSRLSGFTPGTHCIGGWVRPRSGLVALEQRRISLPCWKWNSGRPSRSPSLYRLSCPMLILFMKRNYILWRWNRFQWYGVVWILMVISQLLEQLLCAMYVRLECVNQGTPWSSDQHFRLVFCRSKVQISALNSIIIPCK
jgi:hypothetical protein